jgi:glucose/arabinose dehydrogenase
MVCARSVAMSLVVVLMGSAGAFGQPPAGTGHRFSPQRRDFSEERMQQLKLPDGFAISVFAKDLGSPRMMAVSQDGTVYVTRREGDVIALRDTDGDGAADDRRTVAQQKGMHGIYIHNNETVYLATVGEVFTTPLKEDGSFGELKRIIDDLPTGAGHHNRTLAIGPDGMLYITVGSTCNACIEENKENATMLIAKPDGSNRRTFAKGLRNTIGFGWHPVSGKLFGFDHGIDWLGNDIPPEELNHIVEGEHYGWPWVWGDRQINPLMKDQPPAEMPIEQFAQKTKPPLLGYQAHSSPLQMVYYTADQFPAEYENDAFIAMRGSWNRKPATGYKIVRVKFDESGEPKGFEDFVSGFLLEDGEAHFGRLAGVAVAKDGALLFSDDANGVIYRVRYEGDSRKN